MRIVNVVIASLRIHNMAQTVYDRRVMLQGGTKYKIQWRWAAEGMTDLRASGGSTVLIDVEQVRM